ncbi:hypothetical protein CVT26_013262 [Gymnopilus dilepis]|uniref:DUF4604 domain-containing protein n=1 Tax=Gymnopilus dilepis TaxID=231916 RepID=A0A409WDK8_9AGAR|nr:hypothetical protein CVT26_013262 [Gymnopilus dilepis]
MAPRDREPTRAQFSSKLAYQSHTPNFLLKLQNRMNGVPDEEDDDEEFEYVGGGREPIPKRPRPPIPERPAEDPGSADEDAGDEKPQVVVLKEGKHLTEWEAENIRRAEKGLPPLPDSNASIEESKLAEEAPKESSPSTSKSANQGLSFSSSSKPGVTKSNKRKAVGQLDELKAELKSMEKGKEKGQSKSSDSGSKSSSKKAKKNKKTLLSFGDDA